MFKELNILKLFFEEPSREFNVREVARLLGISPATASKDLKILEKTGLLKKRKERILDLYVANMENEFYRDLKIFYNVRKLRDSGLITALNKYYLKPTILLFGSASAGMDTETSDFDLVILSEKTERFFGASEFEKKINRKLQLFCVKKIEDIKNEHLINNILNGIVIQGRVKWI